MTGTNAASTLKPCYKVTSSRNIVDKNEKSKGNSSASANDIDYLKFDSLSDDLRMHYNNKYNISYSYCFVL